MGDNHTIAHNPHTECSGIQHKVSLEMPEMPGKGLGRPERAQIKPEIA
jgi:hypothetical protein